jgi:cell division protein FtsI (penicillin-binding protein 3)
MSLFLICYLVVTAAMAWRLVGIQVVSADEYRNLAERQSEREITLPARRGKLYDRAGEPLAMSVTGASIYADPRQLAEEDVDVAKLAGKLAPVVGRESSELVDEMTKDRSFVYLGRQLDRQVGKRVSAMNLEGVGVLDAPRRLHPADGLAAQVLGFAGIDQTGLSGLEAEYDGVLAGEPGQLRRERAPGGLTISAAPRQIREPVPGSDVVLSLDRELQYTAERVLAKAVKKYSALGGSAVVMDVATGEVLAMASTPRFEPGQTGSVSDYARRNRAVTDTFEPGSVNKAITASAALEEGVVSADETLVVPDSVKIAWKTFTDSHDHPTEPMSFSEIIAQSSNIGTIKVARRLGQQRLHDYMAAFGYGEPTGLDFPGETAGLLPPVSDWTTTSLPTMAIGQGVSASLLQVAGVFTTIARDGEWISPTLAKGRVGPDGELHPTGPPQRRRVVSPSTAQTVRSMLVGVVEGENGTGERARIPGYQVAGKTGTAQKPRADAPGYKPGAFMANFVGLAPAARPELVTAVSLDEPSPIYGGVTAAPAFSEIMGFALRHRGVAPAPPPDSPDGFGVPGSAQAASSQEGTDERVTAAGDDA